MASSPRVSNGGGVPARITLVLALVLTTGSRLLPLFATSSRQTGQAAQLKIVVIDGESAVNIIRQKTGVPPVVEVRDRNDLPVSGALVTFTIGGGQNATFGGALQTLTVTTNAAGRAAAAGLTPTSTGAVQINVAAAFQGQTATATIAQTNFATAAQAAQAAGGSGSTSSAGARGGGLSGGAIAGIGAAAAGGAVLAVKKLKPAEPPTISGAAAIPPIGLQSGTTIIFGVAEIGGSSDTKVAGGRLVWDFGDGTSGGPTDEVPFATHVYSTAGTFTARATFTATNGTTATDQTTVTIKSVNGRWTLGATSSVFDFVQSGTTLNGSFTVAPPATGSGSVIGTIQPGAQFFAPPSVTFTLTQVVGASNVISTFTGRPGADVNTLTGAFAGGMTAPVVTLARQ